MKNFRTYQLAKEFYRDGRKLEARLDKAMKDQFQRASLSIVLNLAEGSGKLGKDRARFFQIAYGSAKECEAILDIKDLNNEKLNALCGSIFRLIQNPGPGPRA